MPVIIERACLQDLDDIEDLEKKVFTPSDGLLTRRAFRYHLKSNNLLLVARQYDSDLELAGYILVLNRKISARIYSLATNPMCQRQGVAKTLVQKALDVCIANHLHKVTLEVRITNVKALSLYKTLGFEEKSIYHNYYEDNEDAYRMEWRKIE